MITINLYHEFFFLMCSNALFSTFQGTFRANCIEQFTTFEREFFRCLLSYREDARNRAYGFPFLSGTRISNHLQMSSLGDSTLSSDILRLRVMVQSWAWTIDLWRSTTWTKLNRRWYWRGYWLYLMLFTHIPDIDTPDTIDTWGEVTCHKPHNPLLTKSENIMLTAYVWKTHLS